MSLTLSAYWASEVDSPSMVTSGMSLRVTLRYNASNRETSPDNDLQAEQPSMIVLEARYGIVAALALTAARVLPWRRRDLRDDTQQWSPAGSPAFRPRGGPPRQTQAGTSHDRAQDLGGDVADRVVRMHLALGPERDRSGGVEELSLIHI